MTTTECLRLREGVDLDTMTDHDGLSQYVFNQTPDGDTQALGDNETFDWHAIEGEHTTQARAVLLAQGVRWDPDTGVVICPPGMDATQVAAVWERAREEADESVLGLIEEVRQGKPGDDGERTAGDIWVRPV